MYSDEEPSEIIGEYCTLLEDYRGYTSAQIVGDYGCRLVVKVSSGAEIVVYRDEVVLLN